MRTQERRKLGLLAHICNFEATWVAMVAILMAKGDVVHLSSAKQRQLAPRFGFGAPRAWRPLPPHPLAM